MSCPGQDGDDLSILSYFYPLDPRCMTSLFIRLGRDLALKKAFRLPLTADISHEESWNRKG
jgi:hypothetical protein